MHKKSIYVNKKLVINKNAYTILFIISATIFTSLAQLFFKFGSTKLTLNYALLYNWQLLLGLICYSVGAIILLYALKSNDLNYVYPFLSLSMIWVSLLSLIFFKESINYIHGIGILIVIIGITFVGRGNSYV